MERTLTTFLRRHAWRFSPSEVLASALLLLFLAISLGAWFSNRMGAAPVLGFALLDLGVWALWLATILYRHPSPLGGRGFLRLAGPFLVLLFIHDLAGRLVRVIHPQTFDLSLRGLGSWFWKAAVPGPGSHLAVHVLSLLYLSLFVWFIGLLLHHLLLRQALFQRFLIALLVLHGSVSLGHLLFPSEAPRLADPAPWAVFGGWAYSLVDLSCCRVQTFPSLHGVLAAALFFWQWRHDRRGLVWGAPLAAGIAASALLLGDLYPADLVSGTLLAACVVWSAPRIEKAWDVFRASLNPPVTWLTGIVEGRGAAWGKLAGRMGDILPLGGAVSPGVVFGPVPRHRG